MYPGDAAGGATAAGDAALAVTGMNTVWMVVLGVTLVVAGLAVTRLVPRRRRVRI